MDTKLTLQLNKDVIEQAKRYAKRHNTSLSKLIESMLGKLVSPTEARHVSPLVKSLSGVLNQQTEESFAHEYEDYLKEKYK